MTQEYPTTETSPAGTGSNRLIASSKVEGTAVFNRHDERLGTVDSFMIDKKTGHVEYAVMSLGGFLGMGESYHPLPWKLLEYDTNRGGYVVDLDKASLEKAPSYRVDSEPWQERVFGEKVNSYYGVPIAPIFI